MREIPRIGTNQPKGTAMMIPFSYSYLADCGTCQVEGPTSRKAQPAWLAAVKSDRNASLRRIAFNGGVFGKLEWTQDSFVQPQVHPYDRYFYDHESGQYTIERFVDDLRRRYGGADALLVCALKHCKSW